MPATTTASSTKKRLEALEQVLGADDSLPRGVFVKEGQSEADSPARAKLPKGQKYFAFRWQTEAEAQAYKEGVLGLEFWTR